MLSNVTYLTLILNPKPYPNPQFQPCQPTHPTPLSLILILLLHRCDNMTSGESRWKLVGVEGSAASSSSSSVSSRQGLAQGLAQGQGLAQNQGQGQGLGSASVVSTGTHHSSLISGQTNGTTKKSQTTKFLEVDI